MPSSEIEEIKARLGVVDVIAAHVPLQRAGRTFKGLCPFHSEKTPSFIVFPETGTWHCFGCHEGGDIFSFLMKREGLDFPEALRQLAARAGVTLSRSGPTPEERAEQARLYQVLDAAALYYHALLRGPQGAEARAYLERRGVRPETVDAFLLGYYPDTPGALVRHLGEQGFSEAELIEAGLAGRTDTGTLFERFRGRLLFSIRDARGRTIAFGGRALKDGVQPKYLNSPQSPIFDKGATLYGLDRAREAIRRANAVVIVEGYMDVVIAHQAGFQNVVATLGTAITERHLDQLKRLARDVVLALDPDAAGQAATLRGLEVARHALAEELEPVLDHRGLLRFQAAGQNRVKVMVLPEGQDPDDLIRADPEEWRRLAAQAEPVVDFVITRLGARFDLSTPSGRAEAARAAGEVIAQIADPIERAAYVQRAAQQIGVSEAVLGEAIRLRLRRPAPSRDARPAESRQQTDELELYALALLLRSGRSDLAPPETDLLEPPARGLLPVVRRALDRAAGPVDPETLELPDDPASAAVRERICVHYRDAERLRDDVLVAELETARLQLRERRLGREVQQLLALLGAGGAPGPEERRAWERRLAEIALERDRIRAALQAPGRRLAPVAWRLRNI